MSFVSWSVYPKGQEFDAEYFTSEDHAVDVAYSWSAEEHGKTMIVARNDMMWMEVTCWFLTLNSPFSSDHEHFHHFNHSW